MLGRSSLERSLGHDDITTGNNEWLNIQDIVRLTFKQMSNTLQSHERAIQGLEKQLSLKASRSEVQALASHKLDIEEFHIESNNLRGLVQAIRADTSDLICASREDYVNDYRKIVAELETKCNKVEVKSQISELDYQRNINSIEIKELKKELDGKIQAVRSQMSIDIDYSREMNMIEFDKILEGNKAIINEINSNKRRCDEISEELMKRVMNLAEESQSLAQIQQKSEEEIKRGSTNSLNSAKNELFGEINSIVENFNRLTRDLEQVKTIKADSSQVSSLIQLKSDEISLLREELVYASNQIKTKTPLHEFEKELKTTKDTIEHLRRELNLKYDKKIGEIEDVIETKATKDDHSNHISKQEAINETLCSENTTARWYIENKREQRGEVSWEKQSVNTCPENFIWQSHNSEITVVNSGCYEVCLGFYSEKKPLVQVYVNSELVFSLVNCAA